MKSKRLLTKIISFVLCILFLFGSVVTAHGNTGTDSKSDDEPYISFVFAFFKDKPEILGGEISAVLVYGTVVKVLGYSGLYVYVEDVRTEKRGYIFYWFVDDKSEFNREYEHVYVGQTNSGRLKHKNGANIEWTVNTSGYITVDPVTKIITGIKPGTVTITAKAGLRIRTCTVVCINPWKEQETSIAENNIDVFPHYNSNAQNNATIPKGSSITVKGDLADGSGWIYVNSGNTWGFIKLSDFPGIDYLFTEYHYYDQGYNIRFGSAENKIYTYASVMNDVMMDLFKLKVNPYVYSYTSPADKCKIWRYGSVKSNNLANSCPKSGSHKKESCLTPDALRNDLKDTFSAGNDYIAKAAWTGHIMDGHKRSNSQRNPTYIIVFTTGNTVDKNTNQNKSNSNIRKYSIYELIHETSHQLGVHDHYCYGKNPVTNVCKNPYCDDCVDDKTAPFCIMNLPFNVESYDVDDLFCDECKQIIKAHLADHH